MAVPAGTLSAALRQEAGPRQQGPAQRRGEGTSPALPNTRCPDLVHRVRVRVVRQARTPEQRVLRTARVPHQHLAAVQATCGTQPARPELSRARQPSTLAKRPPFLPTELGRGATVPKAIPRRISSAPLGRPHPGSSSTAGPSPLPSPRVPQHNPFPRLWLLSAAAAPEPPAPPGSLPDWTRLPLCTARTASRLG